MQQLNVDAFGTYDVQDGRLGCFLNIDSELDVVDTILAGTAEAARYPDSFHTDLVVAGAEEVGAGN